MFVSSRACWGSRRITCACPRACRETVTEVEELDYVRVRHVLCVRNRTVIAFIARRLVAQVGLFCLNTRSLLGGGGWAPVYILPLHAQRFLSVDREGAERDRCLCVYSYTDWRQDVRRIHPLDIHPPARSVSMCNLTMRSVLWEIIIYIGNYYLHRTLSLWLSVSMRCLTLRGVLADNLQRQRKLLFT